MANSVVDAVTRRANSHGKLASQNHVSQDKFDAVEQQRIEIEQNVKMAENRERQIQTAIESMHSERSRLISAQNANLQGEQHEFISRVTQLEQEILKTELNHQRHVL